MNVPQISAQNYGPGRKKEIRFHPAFVITALRKPEIYAATHWEDFSKVLANRGLASADQQRGAFAVVSKVMDFGFQPNMRSIWVGKKTGGLYLHPDSVGPVMKLLDFVSELVNNGYVCTMTGGGDVNLLRQTDEISRNGSQGHDALNKALVINNDPALSARIAEISINLINAGANPKKIKRFFNSFFGSTLVEKAHASHVVSTTEARKAPGARRTGRTATAPPVPATPVLPGTPSGRPSKSRNALGDNPIEDRFSKYFPGINFKDLLLLVSNPSTLRDSTLDMIRLIQLPGHGFPNDLEVLFEAIRGLTYNENALLKIMGLYSQQSLTLDEQENLCYYATGKMGNRLKTRFAGASEKLLDGYIGFRDAILDNLKPIERDLTKEKRAAHRQKFIVPIAYNKLMLWQVELRIKLLEMLREQAGVA